MTDKFSGHVESLSSPPSHIVAVTPDDANDLAVSSRCINVATAGDVQVTTINGETGVIHIAAGVVFPIRASRIWATGTTATGIVVMF